MLSVRPRDSAPCIAELPLRMQSEQQVLALCAALELARDAVLFVEPREFAIVATNRAACELLGYSEQALATLTLRCILPDVTTEDLEALARGTPHNTLTRSGMLRRHDGHPVSAMLRLRLLETQPRLLVVAAQPIDPALPRDFLTGLPTRAALDRRLHEIFDTPAPRGAVLFCDVDQFKQINDRCGHWAGDQVLKATAQRLSACLDAGDLVARYGGDEFVAILNLAACRVDAAQVATQFRQLMKTPVRAEPHRLRTTASVGIALGRDHRSPEALLRAADRALYRAKSRGRAGHFAFEARGERQPQTVATR